ncbi:MAG: S-layer homology domain-containing protein [Solibacillus sp.]
MKRNQMNKWFLATLVTMVGVAAPAPASVEAAKAFSDVPAKHVYNKEIGAMTELGIIHGYPDGTFRPTEKITRKHAAALISRAFDKLPADSSYANKTASDVSAKNAYKVDIDKVIKAGVIVPDAKGNFRPNDLITRGEMAQALAKAYQLDKAELTGKDATFIDKAKMNSFTAANLLYKAGITTGYDDNTFREKEGLSRAHYAVFMYRAANLAKAEAPDKPKPSEPSTPSKPVEDAKPVTSPEEKVIKELSEKLSKAEPPAGKSREDATAENVQSGKSFERTYKNPSHINEVDYRSVSMIQGRIDHLLGYGYTLDEALKLIESTLNGNLIEAKSPDGRHVSLYLKYEKDTVKLVTQMEK